MRKIISFLIALLTLCTCSISSFATDKETKEDVLNKITTLSYVDTYYLTEYGDSDSEYECYKNSVSYAGFPTFVFFENDCLVTESTKIGELSQIAIANYYEEYYSTWLNNIDVIDDGLDSAKLNEVIMLVGKYSSKLAGTLLTYNVGIDDAITWPILRGILSDVEVSEFTDYLADVENNIDTFNIIYTHSTIEEARELKKQLSLMSENDKKTYSGASIACHRLQKIHENVEMATAMFSQVAYDSPKISDYWEEIGKGFMAGATNGMIDSIFYGPNITSSEAKENYLEQLLHDDRKLDEFHELIRVLYIFDTIDKVAIKNPEYLYKTMQQFSEILPYTKSIIEKYEHAKEYNYIKIATMLNQSLLKENGYKIAYENNGSSRGTSGDTSSDIYETTENESYVSNYTLSNGTLDLDGQTMYVGGDFLHTGGTLNLGSGKLVIFGNYLNSLNSIRNHSGLLTMTDVNGHMLVYGDFVMDSTQSHTDYLTNGVLEIKGNFTQKRGSYNYTVGGDSNSYNFNATGNHKVILSGNGEQIVRFETPQYSGFADVEFKNTNIKIASYIKGWKLQRDTVINNDVNYSICYINPLDLNGHKLEITGSYIHNIGTMIINGGKFVVGGNYDMGINNSKHYGLLTMTNADDYVLVHGDFVMDSTQSHTNYLTNGVLEVKGDFTQRDGNYATDVGDSNSYNFNATGNHKVILSGTGEQIVRFETPSCSQFNVLEVKNKSGLLNFEELTVDGELIGDIISGSDIVINNSSVVLSNQTITAPNIYMVNGSNITIVSSVEFDGNFCHTSGILSIKGKLDILGDYLNALNNTSNHSGLLTMTDVNGYMLVYGDFVMDSTQSHTNYLTNGVLEVKGNFTQRDGNYATDVGDSNSYNFNATGNHKVILSGTGEQIVRFTSPSTSGFNILKIKNTDTVVFATAYRYNKLEYPFDFEMSEYVAETNQIKVGIILCENLQSLNGNVIISLYDDSNKLIDCRVKELSELEPQTFNGPKDYEGTYIIKAFYWANMTSIRPLFPSIQKELVTQ